jgi:hypothetical protein
MAKKAAKKKSVPGGGAGAGSGGGTSRKNLTIVLVDNKLPDPLNAEVSKNGPNGPADRVRWDNQSGRGRTIQFDFDWWPFVEAPTLIELAAGKKSAWFTLAADAPSSGYGYSVSPPLVAGTGPDEPKVTAGD